MIKRNTTDIVNDTLSQQTYTYITTDSTAGPVIGAGVINSGKSRNINSTDYADFITINSMEEYEIVQKILKGKLKEFLKNNSKIGKIIYG